MSDEYDDVPPRPPSLNPERTPSPQMRYIDIIKQKLLNPVKKLRTKFKRRSSPLKKYIMTRKDSAFGRRRRSKSSRKRRSKPRKRRSLRKST